MKPKHIFTLFGVLTLFACHQKDTDPPQNKVPIANAGPSDSIELPKTNAILAGSGTDEDGSIVSYLWSEVAGPNVIIDNPGSATTKVEITDPGVYLFQLMVTDDKGATGVDTTSLTVTGKTEKQLQLQPSNNPNEYQVTQLGSQDVSGTNPEISIDAWTSGGALWTLREYFKFDLSQIPQTATIKSAHLYLYSNPTPTTGNLVDANFGTDNSMILSQVTQNWSPSTIGWYNQPSIKTANSVNIATTDSQVLDLNLDVTDMIASMVNTNANYGFALKLVNEVTYNSRIFVSSFNTTYPDKHPKLVITYE